jgi:hypothetical protein
MRAKPSLHTTAMLLARASMLKQLALLPGDVRCSAAVKLAANMSRKLMLPSLASTAEQQQKQHITLASAGLNSSQTW